jgi:hypothetical protein
VTESFICPHCGADVPVGAAACPECGSDHETGWSDEAEYNRLFQSPTYDDEPERGSERSRAWTKPATAVLAAAILSIFLATALPWGLYVIPVVFVAIGSVYYWTEHRPDVSATIEDRLYEDLLQKARWDVALVERWIEYERKRSPRADRGQLMEDAIYRWERDNR